MDLDHVRAFIDAMGAKDLEAMLAHMTNDMVLKTPLAFEPFRGKAAVRPVGRSLNLCQFEGMVRVSRSARRSDLQSRDAKPSGRGWQSFGRPLDSGTGSRYN